MLLFTVPKVEPVIENPASNAPAFAAVCKDSVKYNLISVPFVWTAGSRLGVPPDSRAGATVSTVIVSPVVGGVILVVLV